MKKILALLLGSMIIQNASACTALNVKANDGSVIAGRTMEWAFDMDWQLLYYPKGSAYTLSAPATTKLPTKQMVSKYAVLGVGTGVENNAMLEGQNSAGLAISGNFLPGFTEYQQVTAQDKNYISVLEFIRFILSNYATIPELQKELPNYKVWAPQLQNLPVQPSIHFMITDKTGKNIVVEFIHGKMTIFNDSIGIMTNSPNYDWHLTNVRNYVNLTNLATSQRNSDSKLGDVTAIGQGGGAMGLPGDYTPPARFVKTTFLAYYADKAKNASEAISLTDHILNSIDIPKGVVSSIDNGSKQSDYTQWVAIKDLNHNQLYFADYNHRTNFLTINLDSLITQNSKSFALPINKLAYPNNDITTSLLK